MSWTDFNYYPDFCLGNPRSPGNVSGWPMISRIQEQATGFEGLEFESRYRQETGCRICTDSYFAGTAVLCRE